MPLNKRVYIRNIKEDLAHFSKRSNGPEEPSNLESHFEKHQSYYANEDEYDQGLHDLTKRPAAPIGKESPTGINGYKTQTGVKVKYRPFRGNIHLYELGAYRGNDVTGVGITYYAKPLDKILQDIDPYTPYPLSRKKNDYRYKSDLEGGFEGLEFFDNHPEYHEGVDEETINTIRAKIMVGERLDDFNTI